MTERKPTVVKRSELLQSIAKTIADYRTGEIPSRTPAHINEWLQQFPEAIQDPLLEALAYVIRKTYVSHDKFREFLKGLASTDKLSPGTDPKAYWRRTNLLNIQQGGNSQKEILSMFDEVIQEEYGFGLEQTGGPEGDFIYLDDCIATGSRLRGDVCNWLKEDDTPRSINLHVITPILFTGSWWIDDEIRKAADESGKTVVITKWRLDQFEMENRLKYCHQSDVLWPTSVPDQEVVRRYYTYLEGLDYPPVLRDSGHPGVSGIFRDDAQKTLIEKEFLVRGCHIREEQINLPDKLRPLGYSNLHTFGFGSMFVTYRNCPNNCPLVFWVEQNDFPPLFPRKTNTETSI